MNTIEEKVKEFEKNSPIYLDEDKDIEWLRQALLSLYNQGQVDALGRLESVLSGYEGNRVILRADVLSHIASLKEKVTE